MPHHSSWVTHCTLLRDPVLGCVPEHPEHVGSFTTLHEPLSFSVTVIFTVSVHSSKGSPEVPAGHSQVAPRPSEPVTLHSAFFPHGLNPSHPSFNGMPLIWLKMTKSAQSVTKTFIFLWYVKSTTLIRY